MTGAPFSMASVRATSAPALARQHSSGTLLSTSGRPSLAARRRKRKKERGSSCVATKIPLALAAYQQILVGHLVDCLAYRALTHTETFGEFGFAGDRITWTPFAGGQALGDQFPDLPVSQPLVSANVTLTDWLQNGLDVTFKT